MGTILDFNEHRRRRHAAAAQSIRVTAFGFSVGDCFLPWQSVAAIHLHRGDSDDIWLHFAGAGDCLMAGSCQSGFTELMRAMTSVFPSTADWDERLFAMVATHEAIPLYIRPAPPR